MKNGDNGEYRRKPPARHIDPYGVREDGAEEEDGSVIEGRNAVIEALRAGVPMDKVFIAKGETDSTLGHIAGKARSAGAVIVEADRRKLDSMSLTHSHQGVIAFAAAQKYVTVGDMLDTARRKGEPPFIVLCDGISDPHNMGAIIRTAEAAGVHGVVIPKRRSAGMTATVAKASAGAVYHMAVARVPNITAAINELKKAGVWIFGACAGGGTPLWQADFKGACAIVIGSEGSGISRLVKENCDFNVGIPMLGRISSLNASVSAALIVYEAVRQRCGDKASAAD